MNAFLPFAIFISVAWCMLTFTPILEEISKSLKRIAVSLEEISKTQNDKVP